MSGRLPDHTVRTSARAKRVSLTIRPRDGLVVVIPEGFDRAEVPDLLRRKRAWIDRHLRNLQRRPSGDPSALPERIELTAIGQTWSVVYRPTGGSSIRYGRTAPGELTLTGPTDNHPLARKALGAWLKRLVLEHLAPRLRELSEQSHLPFAHVRAGMQRTRWGSCSTGGTISLNLKLLFLPTELVHYVLIHELCHLAHPNHSKRFWALLKRHCPDLDRWRREVRTAGRHVPAWLDPRPD